MRDYSHIFTRNSEDLRFALYTEVELINIQKIRTPKGENYSNTPQARCGRSYPDELKGINTKNREGLRNQQSV